MKRFAGTVRVSAQLPYYLRHPMTVEDADRRQRELLAHREENFLSQTRAMIYGRPGMPYERLLRSAGCEYGDLERMVRLEGLEATLESLFRRGVYLSVDEFKGRTPIVRGSQRFELDAGTLSIRGLASISQRRSGGSRGPQRALPNSIFQQQERSRLSLLALERRGGLAWEKAYWQVPEGVQSVVLSHALRGIYIHRWFALTDLAGSNPATIGWNTPWARLICRLADVPVPVPEYVPHDRPGPILRWVEATRATGGTPHLHATPSLAVHLALGAQRAGRDLTGLELDVSGEPITPARLATIAASGAHAVPAYTASDGASKAPGCLAPEAPDDVHVPRDSVAMIQPGPDAATESLPARALLVSNLSLSSRFLLLNVSIGDQAVMARRECGCPIGALGLPDHLHTIRSFEKLTAAGMTFLDTDIIPILEDILPARFGGGPADYQLVEREAADGKPVVQLVIDPAVGPLDESLVVDAFLAAAARGSRRFALMAGVWREIGLPSVERRAPMLTPGGKIHHVHVAAHTQAALRKDE